MKNICLTFDDGLKSHFEFVRPLLKSNGIKGTFFICIANPWGNHPLAEELMTVEELKIMEEDGFELGNHTHSHPNLTRLNAERIQNEVVNVNNFFKNQGLKKPVSFCYPGYHASVEISEILKKLNFSHARTGYIYDDHPSQHSKDIERPDTSYHPSSTENPLLIKSTGIVNDVYGFEDFKRDVEQAPEDSYCIFTFHGFKDKKRADDFTKIISYIKENNLSTFNLKDVPVSYLNNMSDENVMSERWPFRCPVKFVAEAIKDIIADKVVCDVGCAEGDLMKAITPYCKRAIGVEIDQAKFYSAKSKGLEVYHQNILVDAPEADIYFLWIEPRADLEICKFLLESTNKDITILVNRRKENEWKLGKLGETDQYIADLLSETIYLSYDEPDNAVPMNSTGTSWNTFPNSGEWVVGVIKNHE